MIPNLFLFYCDKVTDTHKFKDKNTELKMRLRVSRGRTLPCHGSHEVWQMRNTRATLTFSLCTADIAN